MRINKFLADCGVASRRKCDELIATRKVTINGEIAKNGDQVDENHDDIRLMGKPLVFTQKFVYVLFNKPIDVITSTKDEFGRKTVLDFLPEELKKRRIYPVGRLDYDSSGLILLTNDGDLAHRITHPKFEHTKVYIVKVTPNPTQAQIENLRSGVDIGDYFTKPAQVEVLNENTLKIAIHEGKHRQIRRMCMGVHLEVLSLHRTRIGDYELGNLGVGEFKFVNPPL